MRQSTFAFASRKSSVGKLGGYDRSNLEAARIILADRARYDTPDSRCVIVWAEAAMRRLAPEIRTENAA